MREEANQSENRSDGVPGTDHPVSDALLKDLLDAMASNDAAVLEDLLMSNPHLAESYHRADPCIEAVRDVLSVSSAHAPEYEADATQDARFAAVVAQIRGQLGAGDSIQADSRQPAGILTDVTRQLSAAQARQLFEKLAPMLAYTTLKHLNRNCTLDEVDRVATRLCAADALARLRSADHVRDALIDEFALALGSDAVCGQLDRDQMIRLLEESSTMGDLVAMANCVTLARTQAG